jgi:hypothetical protein
LKIYRHIGTFWALAAVASLIAIGCGDGEGEDTATASITKAQFIDQASAACEKLRKETRTELFAYLKSSGGEPTDPEELAAYQEDLSRKFVIGLKRRVLDEFRALGVPSNDGGEFQAVITAFEEGIRKAEEDPVQAARNSTQSLGKAEKAAAEYGLTGC